MVFGPGRHPTSSAKFLYFEGPDGMVFEYSSGVREIADELLYRERQFPFEPKGFCHWGAKPAIREFNGLMPSQALEVLVRKAARALGRHGLVHAYGHVSARIDEHTFLVCAPERDGVDRAGDGRSRRRRSTGRCSRRGEDPSRDLPPSPEVRGVARTMPPKIMSLSTLRLTPQPRHGFGSYFYPLFPYGTIRFSSATPSVQLASLMGDGFATRHAGQWAGHGRQKRGGSRCPRLVRRRCSQGRN